MPDDVAAHHYFIFTARDTVRSARAHRFIRGRRFEPPVRRHLMPEREAACRALSLAPTRRPYAMSFTADGLRPFPIVTATHGRRGSEGLLYRNGSTPSRSSFPIPAV